jgi:hypothetical protein
MRQLSVRRSKALPSAYRVAVTARNVTVVATVFDHRIKASADAVEIRSAPHTAKH